MGGEIGDSTGVLVLVQSGVSIQKLRTVVLDYGELLAQLVYLTWLLRGGPGFETQLLKSAILRLGFTAYRSSPTRACHGGARWLLDRLLTPYFHP